MTKDILVLGAGISGLSTGIRLLEADCRVVIWAQEQTPNTTSDLAAAVWYPYDAFPQERVLLWGARTFTTFCELANRLGTGITMIRGLQLLRTQMPDPWWKDAVTTFRHAEPTELIPGYLDGYIFETPRIEMAAYLPYLMRRFQEGGRDYATDGTFVGRSPGRETYRC